MMIKLWKPIVFCFIFVILGTFSTSQSVAASTEKTDFETDSNIIKCPVYDTGSQSESEGMPQFMIKIPSGENNAVIPLLLPSKGVLSIILFEVRELNMDTASQYSMKIDVYKDADCTEVIDKKECDNIFGIYYQTLRMPEEGTYYMKITASNHTGINDIDLCIMPALIQTSNRELKNNTWAYVASYDEKELYHKINVSSEGFITVNTDTDDAYEGNELKITLCNAKKKAILSAFKLTSINNKVIYAVTPGEYYFKVSATSKVKEKVFTDYRIKYEHTKQIDGGGESLKNAVKLKVGSKKEGIQTLTDNSADWYKFTLNSKKSIEIHIDKTVTFGDFTLTLYDARKNEIVMNSNTICESNRKSTTYTTITPFEKGMYYFKIDKADSKSNGYYRLIMQ